MKNAIETTETAGTIRYTTEHAYYTIREGIGGKYFLASYTLRKKGKAWGTFYYLQKTGDLYICVDGGIVSVGPIAGKDAQITEFRNDHRSFSHFPAHSTRELAIAECEKNDARLAEKAAKPAAAVEPAAQAEPAAKPTYVAEINGHRVRVSYYEPFGIWESAEIFADGTINRDAIRFDGRTAESVKARVRGYYTVGDHPPIRWEKIVEAAAQPAEPAELTRLGSLVLQYQNDERQLSYSLEWGTDKDVLFWRERVRKHAVEICQFNESIREAYDAGVKTNRFVAVDWETIESDACINEKVDDAGPYVDDSIAQETTDQDPNAGVGAVPTDPAALLEHSIAAIDDQIKRLGEIARELNTAFWDRRDVETNAAAAARLALALRAIDDPRPTSAAALSSKPPAFPPAGQITVRDAWRDRNS
jgi:hypothetical protein